MKIKLLNTLTGLFLFLAPTVTYAQAPNLGTTADFVLFSSVGAVTNSGITYLTHLTGHVGANSGAISGFGNVDGNMYAGGPQSAQCATDLLIAYNQLNATVPTFFPAPLLGNGQILNAGVYSIAAPTVLNLDLILDGQGNPNAVFIFQIQGALSTNVNSKVKLVNGAKACNVFWKVEGLVSMSAGTKMRGTVIANNAAINMNAGDTLEGRALSINGAVSVTQILGYTPIGCGSPVLTGPIAPSLASAACYGIFSSNGAVTNVGVTTVTGDIGSNNGSATGYNPLFVTGTIHPIPDISTNQCATDLLIAYNYLNTLPNDILLLYPAQMGNNLVLTPHTYLLNGAVTLTDSLYLNAQGNANAVFVIQINGALSTSVNSKIILINGAQSKNVYWKVDGAVDLNSNSIFRGTIVCNNAAMILNNGVLLDGRALTTTGALSTLAMTVTIPSSVNLSTAPVSQTVCVGSSVSFSAAASGSGLTYQWMNGSTNLINGGNISGANSATLTINPVSISDASSNYALVISGGCGSNFTTTNISLVITAPSSITTQPTNQIACPGNTISFSAAATGSGLTYQWRKGTVNLINAGNISGATSATLTINPVGLADVANNYNVVITGGCAPSNTSINVSLILNNPNITSQPTNQAACPGNSASFSAVATGSGLTYQWRKGTVNLINGGNISGATSATLTINPVNVSDAATNYNVVIIGACAPNDTSINVSLSLNNTNITTQPTNQTACEGNSISFSSAATGTGLTYQWKKGTTNLINAGNISGVTTATLTINPISMADVASNYNVVITSTCAPNDTSIFVSLTVNQTPVASINSIASVCTNSPIVLTAQTVAGATYSWTGPNGYSSTAQNSTIFNSTTSDAGMYTLIVSNNGCASSTATILVNVSPCPIIDFFIPEGFSPNGDGINDVFFIRGIDIYPNNNFQIFNRWGDKVFEASPYQNTWSGKAQKGLRVGGDELPVGIYFYVLDLGDNSKTLKGTIYLNR
ncbi:MAG: ice-binding family protein [Bacteroidota bacterium]|nr:ice-binding family protein [Bacteroidota bacterium]MDP3144037.1 ice-binding family protein [Bacteroidota bacterium]MDP3557467.1 ice-binding family protein [Bacteroidota bacterium]